MSDLVGNPEDRFSDVAAHMISDNKGADQLIYAFIFAYYAKASFLTTLLNYKIYMAILCAFMVSLDKMVSKIKHGFNNLVCRIVCDFYSEIFEV